MSAVSIPITADFAAFDAAIAARRANPPTLPVNLLPGNLSPSISAASPNLGQATFGNMANGSNPFSYGTTAMLFPNLSAGGGSGGGQFNQAAAQMQQAAQAMQAAAQQMQSVATSGGSGGGGSRSSGGRSFQVFNTRGLARFIGAGFIARELLSVGNAALDQSIAADVDGVHGDSPLAAARRNQALANTIFGVPLVGQALRLGFAPMVRDNAIAMAEAEEGEKDVAAATRRVSLSNDSLATRQAIDRSTARLGLTGNYERRSQAISDNVDDWQSKFEAERNSKLFSANSLFDSDHPEYKRQIYQINAEQAAHDAEGRSRMGNESAEQRDLLRQRNLDAARMTRQIDPLQLAGAGQFGRSGESSFSASLEDAQAEADARGGGLGGIQGTLNRASRLAHDAKNRLAISDINAQADIAGLKLNRNPLAAILAESDLRRSQILRTSTGDDEDDAINRQFDANNELTKQRFSDRANTIGFRQGASNESAQIALSASDPRLGSILAQENSARRSAELSAFSILNDPSIAEGARAGLASQALRGGLLQLQGIKQGFLRDLQPQQIDSINQQATDGPGTSDGSEAIKAAQDDIAEIKELMRQIAGGDLAAIARNLANLQAQ